MKLKAIWPDGNTSEENDQMAGVTRNIPGKGRCRPIALLHEGDVFGIESVVERDRAKMQLARLGAYCKISRT